LTAARTLLGLWAHPDDEAYLSAGLMAAVRAAGHAVAVATATDGELGEPTAPDAGDLAALRRGELADSLRAVGVDRHLRLGFRDGDCALVDPQVGAGAVRALIEEVRPDTLVSFGPDGLTGHPDHRAVARWVHRAWLAEGGRTRLLQATLTSGFHRRWGRLCARTGVWMPGAEPPAVPDGAVALRVHVHGHTGHRKLAALRAHRSQTAGLLAAVGEETLLRWWAEETFVSAPFPAGRDLAAAGEVAG
jgi:LmbE family N-acetylglucosaminyl deacetylase